MEETPSNKKIKKTEDIHKYRKQYYKNNKDKIFKRLNKQVKCEYCDKMIKTNALWQHNKTNKHKQNEEIFKLKNNT